MPVFTFGGGFSGMKSYAFIIVTYPETSTCTCTKGSVTLTASDTSGRAVFAIPSSGSWVVKSTASGYSASSTVSVSTYGESYSVALHYTKNLFNSGLVSGISWKRTTSTTTILDVTSSPMVVGNPTGNTGFFGCAYTTSKIDCKLFSSLKVTYTSRLNNDNNRLELGVASSTETSSTGLITFVYKGTYGCSTSSVTRTLNISSYTGSYYIAMQNWKNGRIDNSAHNVTKVWLE